MCSLNFGTDACRIIKDKLEYFFEEELLVSNICINVSTEVGLYEGCIYFIVNFRCPYQDITISACVKFYTQGVLLGFRHEIIAIVVDRVKNEVIKLIHKRAELHGQSLLT